MCLPGFSKGCHEVLEVFCYQNAGELRAQEFNTAALEGSGGFACTC